MGPAGALCASENTPAASEFLSEQRAQVALARSLARSSRNAAFLSALCKWLRRGPLGGTGSRCESVPFGRCIAPRFHLELARFLSCVELQFWLSGCRQIFGSAIPLDMQIEIGYLGARMRTFPQMRCNDPILSSQI
jgi:hypothetical protein